MRLRIRCRICPKIFVTFGNPRPIRICWRKNANRKRTSAGGYLTVFLALALPVILSLVFALLDGARRNAVRLQTEFAADVAVNSALAEFSKELFEQYDLLMIDTSYGTGTGQLSNTEQHVRKYMEANLSSGGIQGMGTADFTRTSLSWLTLSETRFALDGGCAVLREQVNAYMSAEPIESLLSDVLSNVNNYNGFGFDLSEWSRKKSQNEEELHSALENAQNHRQDSEEEEDTDESRTEALNYAESYGIDEDHAMNPWKEINSMCSTPILTLVLENGAAISSEAVSGNEYVSHRTWNQGSGTTAQNSHHYEQADALFMNQYIYEKCGNYLDVREKDRLKYQQEYLLFGGDSDRANLEKMAETLLLIRLAANTAFIMTDGTKRAEAAAWGTIIALICLSPELEELFTNAILLSWSYVESVNDLKILFKKGKVPIMKDNNSWGTSLLSIFKPELSGDSNGEGLSYEEYLRILLFLENADMRDYRLMDVMEMDIRKAENSSSFRMDYCMDTFTANMEVRSSFGYSYQIRREATYE